VSRLSLLLPAVLVLTGCAAKAQKFAVTITESATIDCAAIPRTGPFHEAQLSAQARLAEKSWKTAHQFTPPVAQGRVLDVQITDEDGAKAWVEASGLASDAMGTGSIGPNEVYVGEPEDNLFDGIYEAKTNLDAFNPNPTGGGPEASTKPKCANLTQVHAELLATMVGSSFDGRIRRTESSYLQLGASMCDAEIRCARNLLVTGLEQ
jgi:hypothetical protein